MLGTNASCTKLVYVEEGKGKLDKLTTREPRGEEEGGCWIPKQVYEEEGRETHELKTCTSDGFFFSAIFFMSKSDKILSCTSPISFWDRIDLIWADLVYRGVSTKNSVFQPSSTTRAEIPNSWSRPLDKRDLPASNLFYPASEIGGVQEISISFFFFLRYFCLI